MALTEKQTEAWKALEKLANFADRNAGWNAALEFARALAPPVAKPAQQRSSSTRPARQSGAVNGHGGRQIRSGEVCPFGKSKGVPIEELEERDLHFIIKAMQDSLDDPSKDRWREKNEKLLNACEKELGTR